MTRWGSLAAVVIVAIGVPLGAQSAVVTEFMAKNATTLLDEDGEASVDITSDNAGVAVVLSPVGAERGCCLSIFVDDATGQCHVYFAIAVVFQLHAHGDFCLKINYPKIAKIINHIGMGEIHPNGEFGQLLTKHF